MSDIFEYPSSEIFIKNPFDVPNYKLYKHKEALKSNGKCEYWYKCPPYEIDNEAHVVIYYVDGIANGIFDYSDLNEYYMNITYKNGVRDGYYYVSTIINNGGCDFYSTMGNYKNGLKHGIFENNFCGESHSHFTEFYNGKELHKSYCIICNNGNDKVYYTYKCGHKFHITCLELTKHEAWNSSGSKCPNCLSQ